MRRELLSDYLSVGAGGEANIRIVTDASVLRPTGRETVIGRGTKLLAPDGGVDGEVWVMRNVRAEVHGREIVAESGAPLPVLAWLAADAGLSGLEWACGIPGSVGGGTVMNAGAYGGELADVLERVEVVTPNGTCVLRAGELSPAYRRMGGLPRGVISTVTLRLASGDRAKIRSAMRKNNESRLASQPSGRTFGSTFKRVGNVSAGYYIDRAGLKGLRIGGASVSEKHANFIVNEGGSAADVRALIERIKAEVSGKFGIALEEEVIIIGEFS